MRHRRKRRALPLAVLAVLLVVAGATVVRDRQHHSPAVSASGSGVGSTAGSTSTTASTTTTAPPYVPPPVTPTINPALPGEGQWVATDTWDPGPPSVMTTTFRPDPSQPGITAYATWIRTSSTLLGLYPGYEGPGATSLDRGPEQVPTSGYPDLLATFNSGFYEADAAAGFYTNGTLYFPMVDGLATVVTYATGQVDIVDWQSGPTPPAGITMARQNLPLLVNGGAVVPTASIGSDWGVTLHGVPAVWRTGLGVDAQGNLLYVAAPAQTAASLGQVLVDLGAVRAMELDINPEWPIFVTYGGSGAVAPTLFVPNPNQVANRFLFSSTKDFFAVFARTPGESAEPW
jgi:hypothetical protein